MNNIVLKESKLFELVYINGIFKVISKYGGTAYDFWDIDTALKYFNAKEN